MEEKEWLMLAEADFKTATNSLASKDYYASAFWCQQSAEKAPKAVHIFNSNELVKIHDLSTLGRLVNLPEELLKKAALLTPFYTSSRYPLAGINIISDKESTEKAVSYAGEILKWCRKKMQI
ncbi:MAG: HEPN domain-containing protein [Candidatus Pacearchaeota archaeon]